MKRILIVIVAIVVIGAGMFAQTTANHKKTTRKESKTEILTYLASLPDVSVTYLTKSMLQRLPKDKSHTPLGVLVNKGGIESIRVIEFGNAEGEEAGKKLINAYIEEVPDLGSNYASNRVELLTLQNNPSNEVLMYGIVKMWQADSYETVLMYSKSKGKKAVLIILSGSIKENTIGELIDSFSE